MHLICYISEYTGTGGAVDEDLACITAQAKKHNAAYSITGLLFYHQRSFVQFIEGEHIALEGLMDILAKDTRHTRIRRIVDQSVRERGYASWNMDSFNLDKSFRLTPEVLLRLKTEYENNCLLRSDLLVNFYKVLLGDACRHVS